MLRLSCSGEGCILVVRSTINLSLLRGRTVKSTDQASLQEGTLTGKAENSIVDNSLVSPHAFNVPVCALHRALVRTDIR